MPTKSGVPAIGNAQQTNEKIFSVTQEIVKGVSNTLVIDKRELAILNDKNVKAAITAFYKELNTPGTTFRFRAYNFYADKNGKAYTWLSKYDLLVNNETPSEIVRANISGVRVNIKGIVVPNKDTPLHIDGGVVIKGRITMLDRNENHPVPTLYRAGVASVL